MASAQLMTCLSLVTMAAACSFDAFPPDLAHGSELMLAAKCNDVTAAKRLIVTSNINESNINQGRLDALMWAARYGHTKIGKLLVENKAEVNLQSKVGWSALMMAARHGHTDIVKLLVENKADLNLQTKAGWSALMMAAEKGHTKIGTLLVENKADVNMVAASGHTALLVAVEQGHLKMAEDLVEHGADVNAQGVSGKTPLMVAAQNGHKEMVKWLIDKAKASVLPISRAGATAQQLAADSDHDQKLQKELNSLQKELKRNRRR